MISMLVPDFKEFARLAQQATVIPVARTVPADLRTPVSAFLGIAAAEPNAFILESVEGGEKIGRYTFVGARPYMVLRAHGRRLTLERRNKKQTMEGSIFKTLNRLLTEHKPAAVPGLPPFTGGAVGFFAHDAVRQLEKLPVRGRYDRRIRDTDVMLCNRLVAFDNGLR